MKAMRIITIVCWLITAVVLAGLAVWFLTGTVFGFRSDGWGLDWSPGFSIGGWEVLTGPYVAAGNRSIGAEDVKSISIDWIAGDITVKPHNGSEIQVTEFAQRELRDDERFEITTSGGTLIIKYLPPGRYTGLIPLKKLEVLVPNGLSESLNIFTVDSTSGDITIEGISPNTMSIDTTSGDVRLTDSASGSLKMSSTSGSIIVASVQSDDMKVDSLSGDIRVSVSSAQVLNSDTTSGNINASGDFASVKIASMSGELTLDNSASGSSVEADSTSGTLKLTGSFDRVDTESLSGNINVRSTIIPSFVTAETTSGNITITVPNEGSVTVRHSSTSGRFSSEIPVVMQERGAQFELSSLSGNCKILVLG